MNKKILYMTLFSLLLYFVFCSSVFAKETIVSFSYKLYDSALNDLPLNNSQYEKLKEFYLNYINENLNSDDTYLLFYSGSFRNHLLLTKVNFDFNLSDLFKVENRGINSGSFYSKEYYSNSFKITDNDIVFGNISTSTTTSLSITMASSFNAGSLIWSNKPLKYNGETLENYFSYEITNIDDRLKNYYTFNKLSPELPIYTYCNLLFGDYIEEEKEKTSYRIEYYFDDLLDNNKTEYLSGYVGMSIKHFNDYSSDLYKLFSNEEIILTDNVETNVLKVYYRSPLYNTDKKPINIDRSKIHFFYTFSDIKSMFSSITFENFTQYEQFVIVLLFNIFYCLFLFFVSYFLIRASFKCWDWMKSWIF